MGVRDPGKGKVGERGRGDKEKMGGGVRGGRGEKEGGGGGDSR